MHLLSVGNNFEFEYLGDFEYIPGTALDCKWGDQACLFTKPFYIKYPLASVHLN
jgi:hypothetical protein